MNKGLLLLFSVGILGCKDYCLPNSAKAQITPDNTTNTTVNQDGNNFSIENGDRAGANLFHSFQDFSVPTDGSAVFNNAAEINNIFSRVTGGNISNIDGLIQANDANLFLINPAGIVFGANGRLDIGGSFLGTTADSILFEDGEFNAADLENSPLLTVNAPIGLNFRDNPAPITINRQPDGSADLDPEPFDDNLFGLRVADGKTFALAGGDVIADGGGIVAVGGRIEIGAVRESGTLGINFTDDTISFDFPDDLARADVSLTNGAGFLVQGSGGGDIAVIANNINILEGSGLFAGIFNGLGSPDAQAGDTLLDASGSITLTEDARINNNVGDFGSTMTALATGNGGNVFVKTQNLIAKDGSEINVSANGKGNGGNLTIVATESIKLQGESEFPGGLFAQVNPTGEGNAGDLTVETEKLQISDGSRITTSTFGAGSGGNLTIRASNIEVFETPNKNFFRTGIFAGSFNAQNPGSLDFVAISDGNAGNLTIETERLSLQDGGQVSVAINGLGNAGNLSIKATDSIEVIGIEDPNIFEGSLQNISTISAANEGGSGNGGSLVIETNNLEVADGGQISVATAGIGNAGNLSVQVADSITLDGLDSGIFAEATPEALGRGGEITIQAKNINLDNNAQISATTPSERGGNINLDVDDQLSLRNSSLISAQASNLAIGGNINIDADFIIAFSEGNNDIIANAQQGAGGIINISAESVLGIQERPLSNLTNDINASSEVSLDGDVTINTSDINPVQGATELPNNLVAPEQTVAQACASSLGNQKNRFVVQGRGGIPALPTATFNSETIMVNGQPTNSTAYAVPTSKGNIIPARGMIKTADGGIILTAAPVGNNADAKRIANGSPNCG